MILRVLPPPKSAPIYGYEYTYKTVRHRLSYQTHNPTFNNITYIFPETQLTPPTIYEYNIRMTEPFDSIKKLVFPPPRTSKKPEKQIAVDRPKKAKKTTPKPDQCTPAATPEEAPSAVPQANLDELLRQSGVEIQYSRKYGLDS